MLFDPFEVRTVGELHHGDVFQTLLTKRVGMVMDNEIRGMVGVTVRLPASKGFPMTVKVLHPDIRVQVLR